MVFSPMRWPHPRCEREAMNLVTTCTWHRHRAVWSAEGHLQGPPPEPGVSLTPWKTDTTQQQAPEQRDSDMYARNSYFYVCMNWCLSEWSPKL